MQVEAELHEIEINNRTRMDMMYHFTAIGTAVVAAPKPHDAAAVGTTLTLN